jgi:putative DNA-invertase from lambdoid prophage Rac
VQRSQIAGYAMMKGWTVTEVFIEDGVSGSVPLAEPPSGKRLLAAIRKGDVIITPNILRPVTM